MITTLLILVVYIIIAGIVAAFLAKKYNNNNATDEIYTVAFTWPFAVLFALVYVIYKKTLKLLNKFNV